MREYLPGDFTWAYLNLTLKLYCKNEDSQQQLETLLEDVERVIHDNRVLVYDADKGYETTEILVTSIVTDEGLLAPYAIGEMTLQVRYAPGTTRTTTQINIQQVCYSSTYTQKRKDYGIKFSP